MTRPAKPKTIVEQATALQAAFDAGQRNSEIMRRVQQLALAVENAMKRDHEKKQTPRKTQ